MTAEVPQVGFGKTNIISKWQTSREHKCAGTIRIKHIVLVLRTHAHALPFDLKRKPPLLGEAGFSFGGFFFFLLYMFLSGPSSRARR